VRLAIFATHPIQYQVPLWRLLARTSDLDVKVFYFSDLSVRGDIDPGFSVPVAWDVPLLEGYQSEFITRNADLQRPGSVAMPDPKGLLRNGRFDWALIQGYTHCFERQVIQAAGRLGIKVLIRGEFSDLDRGRGPIKEFLRRRYLKWFYSHVDAFCTIGQDARRHLLRWGVPDDRLFFSPYCVDTTHFHQQSEEFDRNTTRARLGLTNGVFTFLFSGKLIPRKEPLLLLEAFERLSDRENMALIVLGDGPLKDRVVQRGRAILGPRFLFQGFVNQSHLGQYFLAADAFVLPSNFETWGLVVNEAMQFGLPVVVSHMVGCGRDLVPENRTGFVFPSGDSEALGDCLRKLAEDRQLARRMGRQSRQVISAYTVEAAVDGILKAVGIQ